MRTRNVETFEIFPWNTNFETGIDLIDRQHRRLVDILNRLAMQLADHSCDITLDETFRELADYASYHFISEEEIWSEYLQDDPSYRAHIATHCAFVDEVQALKSVTGEPLEDTVYDVVAFLSRWLAYHILDTDKRMAKTIAALQRGADLEEAKADADAQMSGSMKLLIDTVLDMYESLSTNTLDLMREKMLRNKAEAALKDSEDRWKFILEGGVEDVWDWDIEHDRMTQSESTIPKFSVVGTQLKPGQHVTVHPADLEALQNDFEAHMDGRTEFYTGKYRILRKNGSWSWFLTRGKVVSRDKYGKALRMVGTHTDITERELAAQIFNNSSQGIIICDMNNNIIGVNAAFTRITGYDAVRVLGKNPKILASGRHNKTFFKAMWDAILTTGRWRGELFNKRRNGEIYPQLMMINTVKDSVGNIDHFFAIFDDISDKKKADEIIFRQANYDPLTKLPNRRMFQDRLELEIRRSNRNGMPFALLFIDLDHFKDVNDTLGHEIGDRLLVEAAERIAKHIRESDTVARLGGDEFTVIMTDVKELIGLETTTRKLIDSLSEPFDLDDSLIHVSASVGITLYPYDAKDSSQLLKHADQAMYLAKRSGRNCYEYFTPSMQVEARRRQVVIGDLHRALDSNQFEIHYQPIVDLKTGRVGKAEALIRWHHPEKGSIPPDEFIRFAEESGLIIQIGDWVYREATRQTKRWQERFGRDFQVSVNKSPVQFRSSNRVTEWIEHLAAISLSGNNSVIEITESLLMEHEGRIADKLMQLRSAGVQISLDDFGTGYSSLSYLQKFRIDYLKIDKSFVSNLTPDSCNITLCEAIVTMAHKLDIKVIAEGIETEFQRRLLSDMGCDYGQGYAFSKPLPAGEFETLLERKTKW